MKTRLKKYLNKHKNRIFSLIAVMVFIPMFSFNTFAYNLYDRYPFLNGCSLTYYYNNFNSTVNDYISEPLNDYNFIYQSSIASASNVDSVGCVFENIHDVPVNTDIYDYYLVGSYTAKLTSISSFTFFPSRMVVRTSDHNHVGLDLPISDVKFYHTDGKNEFGFSYSCKVDLSQYTNITNIIMYSGTSGLTMPSNLYFQHTVIALSKDASAGDAAAAIVNAINNQTSALGGKIDDTNDYINFGNGSTSGIVSGNNSAIDNLDEVVSEYHATEQQFFDDFTANQQAINSDIVGWSWGGLVNCANWVGETMTDYYNNMGDFRQYIIYPLMLGIVLFFLGRGGAIIGHLFRKPTQSTVNIESTSFKRGNTRYTTTTTSKKGGVFRK